MTSIRNVAFYQDLLDTGDYLEMTPPLYQKKLTTLKTAHTAIRVLDIKNIASRIDLVFTITSRGPFLALSDLPNVFELLRYRNTPNANKVAPNDPRVVMLLKKIYTS